MPLLIPVRPSLILRTLEPSDAPAFFALTQKHNTHLRQFLGWLDDDQTPADTEKYIIESNKRFEQKEGLDVGIFYDDKQVGGIGLFPWDTANRKTSVAYWLTEDMQGQGIMSDALKALINYTFTEMGINRIEVTVSPNNTRSLALPKKLGFTREGVARESTWLYDHFEDAEVWSLLKKEWKS